MPKAKLVTRATTTTSVTDDNLNKGSALSHAEMDSNLINLRDSGFTVADDTSTTLEVTNDKTLTIAGSGSVTTSLSGDTLTIGTGGDLSLDGVEITDNVIKTNRSNDTLFIEANGTGHVVIGEDNLIEDDVLDSWTLGTNSRTRKGVNISHTANVDLASQDQSSDRYYFNTKTGNFTLTSSGTGDSDERIRQNQSLSVDLAGFDTVYEQDSLQSISNVIASTLTNTHATQASTAQQVLGVSGVGQAGQTGTQADLTVTRVAGMSAYIACLAGSGATTTITNAYGQYVYGTDSSGSGTQNITNFYALYANDRSQATNSYGLYIENDAWDNRIGGLELQSGVISQPTADTDITLSPNGTGKLIVSNGILELQETTPILQSTNSSNPLVIKTTAGNQSVELDADGTGQVKIKKNIKIEKGIVESVNSLTSSSTITVDFDSASVHKVTLTAGAQFVITGLESGQSGTIIIKQDGTGSHTGSFGTADSSSVKFAGGAPTLTTDGNAIDVVTVFYDGTDYLGNIAQDFKVS